MVKLRWHHNNQLNSITCDIFWGLEGVSRKSARVVYKMEEGVVAGAAAKTSPEAAPEPSSPRPTKTGQDLSLVRANGPITPGGTNEAHPL